MSEHLATIRWQRGDADFLSGKFTRHHTWTFDGGAVVPASSAPSVAPPPLSDPAAVDPEEALVAAASSCHMLTYLYFASKQGFQIDEYEDRAVGTMTKNENRVPWVSTITLHPKITYGGERMPTAEEERQLHHDAHEKCFIANSVKSEIKVEPIR
jgi:organic hydroperoxide reductase OsmC/OhrA